VKGNQMAIDVRELKLPYVHPKVFPTDMDMYEQLEMARKAAGEHWLATTNMSYIVLDHKHATAMLKDKRWHNALPYFADLNPHLTDKAKEANRKLIINLEGEEHARIRKIVSRKFSTLASESMRDEIRQIIENIISEHINTGSCDLSKDVFEKYPSFVLAKLIGVNKDDYEKFSKWASGLFNLFSMRFDESKDIIKQSQKELNEYISYLIEEKTKNPDDSLITELLEVHKNNELTIDELSLLIQALITAGVDAVKGQLGLVFLQIWSNPILFEQIKNNINVDGIVEEATRKDSVFRMLVRVASEDIEYNGVLFPKGTIISPSLVSANYDEKQYENPDDFIENREGLKSTTLSYGGGIHHCLGIALARVEMQECMKAIASMMDNIKINGDIIYKDTTEVAWGPISIPISFDPVR
jgi:cytochrome P450